MSWSSSSAWRKALELARAKRRAATRLGWALQWGTVRMLGTFLTEDPTAVPAATVALVGPDEAVRALEGQVHEMAPMWAAQLLQDEDDKLAAQTVIDLMSALWREGEPSTDWWETPLGRAVARSTGTSLDVVSYSVAGAMLGTSKQYVGKLVGQGRLERGPDGGVTHASVRAHLNKQG